MAKDYTMTLVPHTHWDREWYNTFQQFRMRLVKLTDTLLDILETDSHFTYFVFDGQTIVLEDYLEIRPQNRERLRKLCQEGRIHIGPWYVLPDEFLVSGEAMVHNLLIGHLISEEFSRPMQVGYTPDPFGHIGQLPQILAGFGLDNVIFMRGMDDQEAGAKSECWWEGIDGTRVLAIHEIESYCNAACLGINWFEEKPADMEKALRKVEEQYAKLKAFATTKHLLLNNGCDHLIPQRDLPEIIDYVNSQLTDAEVVHGNYETYVQAVKESLGKIGVVKGELHGGKYHWILSGVFSARMYLKQQNFAAQNLLEKWVEPFCAISSLYGGAYDKNYIRYAWKLLLQNHPHDSICGCSTDRVHQDMLPRFRHVEEIGEKLVEESLKHIAAQIDTQFESKADDVVALVVFNPHAWPVTDCATLHVRMRLRGEKKPKPVVVWDQDGRQIPCQVANQKLLAYQDFVKRGDYLWEFDLLLWVEDVPALGYKTYRAEWGASEAADKLEVCQSSANNDELSLFLSGGDFMLEYPRGSHKWSRGLSIIDEEDAGDEYDYSGVINRSSQSADRESVVIRSCETGPVRGTLEQIYDLRLPEGLTEDRQARSERTVLTPIRNRVAIYSSGCRVDFQTHLKNNAKDHRLTVSFEAPECAEHVAETSFGVVKRSNQPPSGKGWSQRPQPTHAIQSFVAVEAPDKEGNTKGLALFSRGLPEYRVDEGRARSDIYLTLLRSVGWLSRDDLQTRADNAGPQLPTPDAQCLGEHTFEYSIYPYSGTWQEAEVWKQAHQRAVPLRVLEVQCHLGTLPKTSGVFEFEGKGVVVSALKRAERTDHLVLRFYNIMGDETVARIKPNFPFKSAQLANLNEQAHSELPARDGWLEMPLRGYQIVTILFEV
jgi:mannosylglycerate hydrolase